MKGRERRGGEGREGEGTEVNEARGGNGRKRKRIYVRSFVRTSVRQ